MRNLLAEMVRYGVTNADLQKVLGCSEKTVRNKLSGETEFSFPETIKIRNRFFEGFRLEYLFAPDKEFTDDGRQSA
jgi:transcriptional antiterminator